MGNVQDMVVRAAPQPRAPDAGRLHDAVRRDRSSWLLGGIILLGIAVRFTTLGLQSFWADEATTHGIVAHGLGHVISTVPKSESTPHLYYVVLWLWSRVLGRDEVGLRSFSALCGTLTIPVVWWLGKQLVSDRAGLTVALLSAVNPLLFWYSQEARVYALLTLLSALTLVALVRALQSPSSRRLLSWGTLSALAISAHYFAAFAVVPEAIWLVLALRLAGTATPARVAVALGPVAAVGGALLPLAIHQNDGRASYIADASGSVGFRLAQLVKQDIVAYDEPLKTLTSILAGALVLAGLLLLVRRGDADERHGVRLPLAVGGGAVVLAVLAAVIGTDYVNTRNLLESWPALAVVIGSGFGTAAARRVGAWTLAALVAISLACVIGVISDVRFQRADWRGAARAMGRTSVQRAIIGDHNALVSLEPYMSGLSNFATSAPVQEVDVFELVYRRKGEHISRIPPRTAAPLPGFSVVQRRETDAYTVLRYRARVPIVESSAALLRLGLVANGAYVALLQKPD